MALSNRFWPLDLSVGSVVLLEIVPIVATAPRSTLQTTAWLGVFTPPHTHTATQRNAQKRDNFPQLFRELFAYRT
jgi:hypothetical protein